MIIPEIISELYCGYLRRLTVISHKRAADVVCSCEHPRKLIAGTPGNTFKGLEQHIMETCCRTLPPNVLGGGRFLQHVSIPEMRCRDFMKQPAENPEHPVCVGMIEFKKIYKNLLEVTSNLHFSNLSWWALQGPQRSPFPTEGE